MLKVNYGGSSLLTLVGLLYMQIFYLDSNKQFLRAKYTKLNNNYVMSQSTAEFDSLE